MGATKERKAVKKQPRLMPPTASVPKRVKTYLEIVNDAHTAWSKSPEATLVFSDGTEVPVWVPEIRVDHNPHRFFNVTNSELSFPNIKSRLPIPAAPLPEEPEGRVFRKRLKEFTEK